MFIQKMVFCMSFIKEKDLNEEKETSTMLKIQKDSLSLRELVAYNNSKFLPKEKKV